MTIFGDMATRQPARRTQTNKCIKTNGQIVFWAWTLDSLLAAPAATTAVWLRVIWIWRVKASPCSRAESVKPAGLKTSILDEGRKKKRGVWKSFPTRCLYTELVLLFRWCSDTGRSYGNTYTLARHTRDRAGDRWGLDAFFFTFPPLLTFFFFLTESAFLCNGSFPPQLIRAIQDG